MLYSIFSLFFIYDCLLLVVGCLLDGLFRELCMKNYQRVRAGNLLMLMIALPDCKTLHVGAYTKRKPRPIVVLSLIFIRSVGVVKSLTSITINTNKCTSFKFHK